MSTLILRSADAEGEAAPMSMPMGHHVNGRRSEPSNPGPHLALPCLVFPCARLSVFLAAVGQTVTLLVPASEIFGQDLKDDVSEDDLSAAKKAQFAGDLLFIVALASAKLSVCTSLFAFSPDRLHRRINSALIVIMGLWASTSFLGTAFQCGSRGPWDKNPTCVDLRAFLTYVEIGNILTDAALLAMPITIIYPLKMPLQTRAIIMTLFGTRIFAILTTIFQLAYLPQFLEHPFSTLTVPYYISTQATLFASISAACVAYFWPFFRSVRSGLVSANITTFSPSYALSRLPKLQQGSKQASVDVRGAFGDNNNYIKITTDTSVHSTTSTSQKERFVHTWDEPEQSTGSRS
ncbi:hypothetical protein O1611_g2124 [Lasiodiplodia mahajangana]|uniref:Uncharacterized protein n=1 Tax=Lasiodiplodia mahajangana TaxID=1108764 RepID=A0ACC2JVR3_9PEZI|nr:hypothetical protein O1611_g2124 [Lasiodiplodia mahajangana]